MPGYNPHNAPTDDPMVRSYYLAVALGISEATIKRFIRERTLPQPDIKGSLGAAKFWKLSTIRAWNPEVGHTVGELMKIKTLTIINRAA